MKSDLRLMVYDVRTIDELEELIIKNLGYPEGTVVELDYRKINIPLYVFDKLHIEDPDDSRLAEVQVSDRIMSEVYLFPGFLKSLSIQVLIREEDGIMDEPELYFTEEALYNSFEKYTGNSRVDYESGRYNKEHGEDDTLVRLYECPIKKED